MPDDLKDGRRFLTLQDGEIYVARWYTEHPGPPMLVFRQHRNRIDRHYRYVDIELDGQMVRASVPVDQPWKETMEHVWRTETRGFVFRPELWACLEEDISDA